VQGHTQRYRKGNSNATHNHHRPQKRILLNCLPESQIRVRRRFAGKLKAGVGRNARVRDAPTDTRRRFRSGGVVAIFIIILGICQEFGQQVVQRVGIGGVPRPGVVGTSNVRPRRIIFCIVRHRERVGESVAVAVAAAIGVHGPAEAISAVSEEIHAATLAKFWGGRVLGFEFPKLCFSIMAGTPTSLPLSSPMRRHERRKKEPLRIGHDGHDRQAGYI
jgi:hypothetical protein